MNGSDVIAETLAAETEPGDLLLVMSNGSFDGLCDKLTKKLAGTFTVRASTSTAPIINVTSADVCGTIASPAEADIPGSPSHVADGPLAEVAGPRGS